MTYSTQRTVARATIRNCTIVEDDGPYIKVDKTRLFVNRGISLWRDYMQGKHQFGKTVDIRIRHIILDEATELEREVWDAMVIGPAR